MGKHMTDIQIGQRFYEECLRLYPSAYKTAKALKTTRSTIHYYKTGGAPSALALARMHYAGGDVIYILTGRRSDHDH